MTTSVKQVSDFETAVELLRSGEDFDLTLPDGQQLHLLGRDVTGCFLYDNEYGLVECFANDLEEAIATLRKEFFAAVKN